MAFLQEYYVMIHRAAGWTALRWFLMIFLANKFIDIAEMSKIIKHYEKLVDMPNWYEEDVAESE
ncbi:hypothetical protein BC629DRAFT_1596406 [Irpex lacteus]|nr:hypothetical protein BC629DRAFT_1596406 [Irpex lacteus]